MSFERQYGAANDLETDATAPRTAPGKVPLTGAVQRKASNESSAAPPILAPTPPAASVDDPFGSHLIGSNAVQLKEEPTGAGEAPLLAPGQVAMAISFYKGQPDLYPPDVIMQIQHAVKSPETGVADPDMVQGVARFQNVTVLKVDGMAGPRTLPRLFQSGLATEKNRKDFVAGGKAVEAEWATLVTPQARAAKLFESVKLVLDRESVPIPSMEVRSLGKASGLFEWGPWKISFDTAAFSTPTITDDEARDISSTAYHEARHAEQHHKMARMLATKGNTAAQIKARMRIPIEIAENAFANPLPRGVEFATASQQFDSVFGAGAAHFKQAEAEAPSTEELQAAQEEAKTNPTPANKAKAARLLKAYQAYHDLPTENDAFATAGDMEMSWDELSTPPPPP